MILLQPPRTSRDIKKCLAGSAPPKAKCNLNENWELSGEDMMISLSPHIAKDVEQMPTALALVMLSDQEQDDIPPSINPLNGGRRSRP